MKLIRQLSSWYFNKRVLPYWMILLLDTLIVFASVFFTYWVAKRTQATYEHRISLFTTALAYSLLGWIGAKCYKTYSGILRFSSFVDLLKVLYSNLLTLVLSVAVLFFARWKGIDGLTALTVKELFVAFALATLIMWGTRILVKLLYDMTNADKQAMPVLI